MYNCILETYGLEVDSQCLPWVGQVFKTIDCKVLYSSLKQVQVHESNCQSRVKGEHESVSDWSSVILNTCQFHRTCPLETNLCSLTVRSTRPGCQKSHTLLLKVLLLYDPVREERLCLSSGGRSYDHLTLSNDRTFWALVAMFLDESVKT
jgi:hypothetical protein